MTDHPSTELIYRVSNHIPGTSPCLKELKATEAGPNQHKPGEEERNMAKKRTDAQRSAWIPGDVYGGLLPGFTINLLVRDIDVAQRFYRDVLGATVHYADPDFAAVRVQNLEFMLHADHTYDSHPWFGALRHGEGRGLGAELRLLGLDPDVVEARARAANAVVVRPPTTRGHGWREVSVQDPDGYVWAVGVLAPKLAASDDV
jgi:catechol 2,3-dioxygenase-like lactoylglutathione lyase family enzyme